MVWYGNCLFDSDVTGFRSYELQDSAGVEGRMGQSIVNNKLCIHPKVKCSTIEIGYIYINLCNMY